MPKQSPAWNRYSYYCLLAIEIAAGASTLAMTMYRLTHVIAMSDSDEAIPCMEQVQSLLPSRD